MLNCERSFESGKHSHKWTTSAGAPPRAFVLTWRPEEKKHSDPVDPEEHEAEEGPERLQDQQGKVDEHFTSHMEEGDGESHTLPHDEHHHQ